MKKTLIVAGLLLASGYYAGAQQNGEAPAPPPPPAPPKVMAKQKAPPPPEAPAAPVKKSDDAFMKRNKDVRGLHIHNNQVTVTLKDNSKEEYNLDNTEDLKKFKAKYGELPEAPPPPPPPTRHGIRKA